MAVYDASRTWFSEMVETLRQEWKQEMAWEQVIDLRNCLGSMLNEIRFGRGFERPSVIPIHCGLISSYTAGLAVYGEINILDKFTVHNRYCIQFCFFAFNGFTLIHCRNLGSRLYSYVFRSQ